ncbi:MAG: O-antigen ligase family protein [Lachnospiraceae bacterium]|nr:O-antigen ligase family protein [Lachnospiraceae bacterium]
MQKAFRVNLIDILIFLFCISMYVFALEERYNIIFRVITVAMIIFLLNYAWHKKIVVDTYIITIFAFLLFSFISVFWAKDLTRAIFKCRTISEILLLIMLLNNYLRQEGKYRLFLFSMTCSTWVYSLYILFYYGLSNFIRLIQLSERVGSELTNVNTIGVCTALGAILTLWYMLYEKRYHYIAPLVLCAVVSISTASKKVVLCFVVGFFLLFTLKNADRKLIKKILVGVIALILLYSLLQLPIFENVLYRVNRFIWTFTGEGRGDGSSQTRWYYIVIGLQEFLKRPFWGVGIGCSGWITNNYVGKWTYLHCNPVELLASVGIIGFVLFYATYWMPIYRLVKDKILKNKYSVLAFCLVVLRLALHIASVEYYDKLEFLYLLLIYLLVFQADTKEAAVTDSPDHFEQSRTIMHSKGLPE